MKKIVADAIYLSNVITLNNANTIAEAIVVDKGKIIYVGDKKTALTYKGKSTFVKDYGNKCIYPGFMDGHVHGVMAANMFAGYVNLSHAKSLNEYLKIMKQFIKDNPGRKFYAGLGLKPDIVDIRKLHSSILDKYLGENICVYVQSQDNHTLWVISKVIRTRKISKAWADKYGKDSVLLDKNNNPTGVLCDAPAMSIVTTLRLNKKKLEEGLLKWQEYSFANGYTAQGEAAMFYGQPSFFPVRYHELVDSGKWKLRTYAYYLCPVNSAELAETIKFAAQIAVEHNTEYFQIRWIKVFIDGVVEARTAWLKDSYCDQKGYHGSKLMPNLNTLVKIITEADKYAFNVHMHAIGDAAIKFGLDAIEKAAKITKNYGQRNILAHLQLVRKQDFARFNKLNAIACVAPMWCPKSPDFIKSEIKYIGKERSNNSYPVGSFFNNKVKTMFHTDFPVSSFTSIGQQIFRAVTRYCYAYGPKSIRGKKEAISRLEALYGLTKYPAYSFRQEANLGSLEVGKIANMSIFDTNFLTCPVNKIVKAKLVNTIVDGKIVY